MKCINLIWAVFPRSKIAVVLCEMPHCHLVSQEQWFELENFFHMNNQVSKRPFSTISRANVSVFTVLYSPVLLIADTNMNRHVPGCECALLINGGNLLINAAPLYGHLQKTGRACDLWC